MKTERQIKRIEIIEIPERFYFKVSAAARYMGLSANTLRKYTDLGLIRAKLLPNGHRLYSKEALDEFVESLPNTVEGSKKSVVFTYNLPQSDLSLTRPGIFVPAKVRENLMEEDKTDANAEVQTGTDRNGAETDRGGHGEWEVDAPQACKEAGIHTQTYDRWRKEYGGLKVEQAKRLEALEKENTRLKRLVAELSLEKQVLQDVAGGNF